MVSPSPSLLQVRLNAVTDRKRLLMPTPGLHKGFVAVPPQFIPPRQRHAAVKADPENPFATRMSYRESPRFPIELIVTESLMAGRDGGRLGDGFGHLDLQYAILSSLGWIDPAVEVVTLVDDDRVVPCLPMKPTDVGVHWIVTPDSTIRTPLAAPARTEVQWEKLSMKQIKRNDALFFLYRTET
jgi:5-formyltetrahydrofolate cyclo-ligase